MEDGDRFSGGVGFEAAHLPEGNYGTSTDSQEHVEWQLLLNLAEGFAKDVGGWCWLWSYKHWRYLSQRVRAHIPNTQTPAASLRSCSIGIRAAWNSLLLEVGWMDTPTCRCQSLDVLNSFYAPGRKIILSSDDRFPRFGLKFQASPFRDLSTGLRCGLVLGQSGSYCRLSNLAGGKFSEGSKNEFGLAHVVAKILFFDSLQFLV